MELVGFDTGVIFGHGSGVRVTFAAISQVLWHCFVILSKAGRTRCEFCCLIFIGQCQTVDSNRPTTIA